MPLLDLPPEIFGPILSTVAREVGIREASDHRLVCSEPLNSPWKYLYLILSETFNVYILDYCINATSKHSSTDIIKHRQYKHIFHHHGGAILNKKVFRSATIPRTIVSFVRRGLDDMLKHHIIATKDVESIQQQYQFDICKAMTAIPPKILCELLTGKRLPEILHLGSSQYLQPLLAAAVGNIEMLRSTLTLPHLLRHYCELFPDPLAAAVASDQLESLKTTLDWIASNAKGKHETGSWYEMRSAAHTINKALRIAVRLHKTTAGNMILEFLSYHRTINRSNRMYFEEDLIQDCIRHGNVPLLQSALSFHCTESFTKWDAKQPKLWKLWRNEIEDMFTFGHKRILRLLLQTGQLHPNHFESYNTVGHYASLTQRTPLAYAMEKRRGDLARILLKSGADVNGLPTSGENKTALWHAAANKYYKGVEFLLVHGANPDFPKSSKNSPMELVSPKFPSKTTFLLKMAYDEGNEAIACKDVWDRYEAQLRDRI